MTATRRLVAIFYADVAGYSRLTGADEEGSHARIMALLDDATARITDSGGTVLRYAGDAILAVFPSVVLAVDTAAAIQAAGAERNAGLAADARIDLRIGINLGDVIEDRGEVYGEGVNLAARLEAAAEPGGLCISDIAHGQVAGKASVTFTDGGEETFKNIARPVRVWRWSPDTARPPAAAPLQEPVLPEKPSIAVLPFANMSGDAEQEYFSDGITEDIITELSRFNELFVIARNSSFTFKGQAVDVREVGRRLGVAYVVEGSVRKVANRVRVTAQLVDAGTGSHVWAERYDRDLEDIFAVQDEVTQAIVSTLPVKLRSAKLDHSRDKPSTSLSAWEHELRGRWLRNRDPGFPDPAIAELKKALELDPGFARAHAVLAHIYANLVFTHGRSPEAAEALSRHHVAQALRSDDRDSLVHAVAAVAFTAFGDHEAGAHHADRAIALNANDYMAIYARGFVLCYSGRPAEALQWFERALRIDPQGTENLLEAFTECHVLCHDYDEALATYRKWSAQPTYMLAVVAVCHAFKGDLDSARRAREGYLAGLPEGYDPQLVVQAHLRMFKLERDRDLWLEGYRRAGYLP